MPNPIPVDKPSRDEELRALVAELRELEQKQRKEAELVANRSLAWFYDRSANELAAILARHDAVAWARSDADGIVAAEIVRGVNGCNEPLGYLHPAPASKREAVVTDAMRDAAHYAASNLPADSARQFMRMWAAALAAKEAG